MVPVAWPQQGTRILSGAPATRVVSFRDRPHAYGRATSRGRLPDHAASGRRQGRGMGSTAHKLSDGSLIDGVAHGGVTPPWHMDPSTKAPPSSANHQAHGEGGTRCACRYRAARESRHRDLPGRRGVEHNHALRQSGRQPPSRRGMPCSRDSDVYQSAAANVAVASSTSWLARRRSAATILRALPLIRTRTFVTPRSRSDRYGQCRRPVTLGALFQP